MLRCLDKIRAAAGDRSGNFGITTALLLIPLMGMVGLAVDVSRALETKTRVQNMADEAILASINSGSLAQKQRGAVGYTYTHADWSKAALADLQAQVKLLDPSLDVQADMTVSKEGNHLQSDLTYTLSIPTTFLRVLNITKIDISGAAQASFNAAIFKDFYLMVDNSPSMGLGATTADINTLNSKIGCAFACHTLDGTNSNYTQAVATGAKFRIDVVRLGLDKIANAVTSTRTQADLYRVALYNLGAKAETAVASKIEELSALSADMNDLVTSGKKLALMTMPTNGFNSFALTDINSALGVLNTRIGAPGDGTSVSQAGKYVILITDGVQNRWKVKQCNTAIFGDSRCIDYIPTDNCTVLKNRGIKIAVLYTTYIPMTDYTYVTYVKSFAPKIPQALQSCASPGLFFQVGPDQGIPEAMEALFSKLTAAPIISY